MSCMPASYQNLKKSRNSGRFCNSPPTGPYSTVNASFRHYLLEDQNILDGKCRNSRDKLKLVLLKFYICAQLDHSRDCWAGCGLPEREGLHAHGVSEV